MFSKLKLFAQILLYTLIIGIGCWVFYRPLNHPMPLPEEAPHLLTAATCAEYVNLSALPSACTANRAPFHRAAASFVQFISEGRNSGYKLRAYRLFPAVLSVLFILLIPALGLRRRGGCFETEDAPFWIALFVITSPPFLCYGSLFLPLSFQAVLFLGLLIAFRAYVQWPGYLSTLFIAIFIAMSISIDDEMAWVTLLMVPAIALGVGWRRIRLYWHTGHFLLLCGILTLTLLVGLHFDLIHPPALPNLRNLTAGVIQETALRLIWLTIGGFGLVAWLGLFIWSLCHPNQRWPKVFAFMFPFLFVASFGFTQGGGFAVPVICLSLILLGMVISTIPLFSIRLLVGGSAVLALAVGMSRFVEIYSGEQLSEQQQREVARTLIQASQCVATPSPKVCVRIADPELCAALIWPIRATSRFVSSTHFNDADIYLTDQLPPPFQAMMSDRPETPWKPYPKTIRLPQATTIHLFTHTRAHP